ncbi:MAG: hypothetical protein AUJ56_01100 [Zetaproteobacteria bacterium CG1_02_49_23]|nr:MAG: hypothetical protein AUJ56_01100 [Zetaproteobacteria bacterium CG1_02_49_23]
MTGFSGTAMHRLKKYLIAGVVALAPLLITVLLINWLIGLSVSVFSVLPAAVRPEKLLGINFPGMDVLLALMFILAVGAVTTHFIGSSIIHWLDRMMERIPLIRTIHKATRQLLGAIFGNSSRAFEKVVLVQFPQPGQWVIGFVTGHGPLPGQEDTEPHVTVFVPSTPLPTTGWLLFVEESTLKYLDLSVEQGMKLVLSGGVLPPEKRVSATQSVIPSVPPSDVSQ